MGRRMTDAELAASQTREEAQWDTYQHLEAVMIAARTEWSQTRAANKAERQAIEIDRLVAEQIAARAAPCATS